MADRSRLWDGPLRRWHPSQVVVVGFIAVILSGAALLHLPIATTGVDYSFGDRLFTATSAGTVTGLQVVDTASGWTHFGQVVIMVLAQIGGFGLMAVSSVVAVALAGRLELRHRLATQAEVNLDGAANFRSVILGVFKWSMGVEATVAAALFIGFAGIHGEPVGRAAWLGLFHAVTSFNNAGFALFSDNLVGFVDDPWISGVIATSIVLGGIGFPVLMELRRQYHFPKRWSLHTKITLLATGLLIVVGATAVLVLEWTNPSTLGPMGVIDKVTAGVFQGITPRTAGFNTIDYGAMRESSILVTIVLMFIGGGSASTASGIKVTTFAVLGWVIWAELRGDREVDAFRRRIPAAAQRQAITVALSGVALVAAGTMALVTFDRVPLGDGLFEATSAFGTVGLTTGITPTLGGGSHAVLIVMMFVGRVGPITLGAALVLRERSRRFKYPEERPLIG
ncbi:TrkH family potassium uptake protein [Candidatus Microthrix parvicella]|uniref:Potassium transporter ATPase n=1 Tax=Candidatus Neomicrothrix parvicella RN1 TaxID=1229780 RepID=R4Z4P0_9ACTN|nr:potassium transporter TrkG [Candidatus Microthrix parvicella]CCM65665.1 potassium transporter ATPase [Candidatus Microthrix parvicella RN1]